MQIFNSRYLDNNQRFAAAVAAGIGTAIVCGIAYGLLMRLIPVESSIFYVLIGWCVGYVIRTVGRGVHKRFGIAGALCVVLAIVIGDTCALFGIANLLEMLVTPSDWGPAFQMWALLHLSTNISALLGLILRAAGVYFGYYYSMIL
ncbi:MAG: hypothetical protein K6G61_07565 [Solobacterium sp.]|nr:hypothetical protein [Solobacterium sp.]